MAQEVISGLFNRLETGMSRRAAESALTGTGARILDRQSQFALADAVCSGDTDCRKRLGYVDRVTARHQGRLYSVQLTSPLTGNRVYAVATVAAVPRGLSMAQHRQRISKALDSQPTVRGSVAFWLPRRVDWVLIVSWNGARFTAVKRSNRLLRDDRIAQDRRRRGR
jgi:hypothetical protein